MTLVGKSLGRNLVVWVWVWVWVWVLVDGGHEDGCRPADASQHHSATACTAQTGRAGWQP